MYKYSSLNEATIDIKETFDIRLDLEKFFYFLNQKIMLEYSLARLFFLILCVSKASDACYYSYYYSYYYCSYYSSDTSLSGGAWAGIVVGMIIFSGIVAAIIFYLVCKNVCPGKSPFSRHLGRTRVVNIPGLVSSNNTAPVQNATLSQQHAYPPITVTSGPRKSLFSGLLSGHFGRTHVINIPGLVSSNNTAPVQNATLSQQHAYPPNTVNDGIGQGSSFQYGQLPNQYGVPPPVYNTNIGSAPPPKYSSMFR